MILNMTVDKAPKLCTVISMMPVEDECWRERRPPSHMFSPSSPVRRSAGLQAGCIADFQVGMRDAAPAGLETRDTADWEVCATLNTCPPSLFPSAPGRTVQNRRLITGSNPPAKLK